jgi:hypothetical protein
MVVYIYDQKEKIAVISIRGTKSIDDAITDLHVLPRYHFSHPSSDLLSGRYLLLHHHHHHPSVTFIQREN